MAGDQFSMADISAFTIAASMRDRLDWAVLSRLSRWFDAIEARPAVQRGLKSVSKIIKRYPADPRLSILSECSSVSLAM